MNIGYFSDLHLEGSNVKLDFTNYDCVIFAGDISADLFLLEDFFRLKVPKNIPVIFVPGNHEFENKEFNKALEDMENIFSNYDNMHFLYNKTVIINDIQFIGTTLWTNFESMGLIYKKEVMDLVKHRVSDFKYILKKENNKYISWEPKDMEKEFLKSYDFLNFNLKNSQKDIKNKIVVTHFPPHKKSLPKKYLNDLISAYSCNQLDSLIGFSDYWIHGHIHNTANYLIEDTRVLCNPRGYSKIYNIHQNNEFNVNPIIKIEKNE